MTSAKPCPNCNNSQIQDAGACPACGYQIPPDAPAPDTPEPHEHKGIAGLIEIDYSVSDDAKVEIPAWRLELSKRLQEIKTRRESAPPPAQAPESVPSGLPAPAGSRNADAEPSSAQAGPERRSRRIPRTPRAVPKLETAKQEEPLLLFRPTPPRPAVEMPPAVDSRLSSPQTDAIQELIDRAVARQAAPSPAAGATPQTAPQTSLGPAPPPAFGPSRWLLLSRTLSGLVDLIITIFCAAAFIIVADAFAGVEILDGFSLVHYGALLIATFLIYSVFFLFTANQTIGMMITDLRVVDEAEGRPPVARILLRCGWYLLALLAVGLGLLWGCVDRQAKCLHDRLSGTKVVRVSAS